MICINDQAIYSLTQIARVIITRFMEDVNFTGKRNYIRAFSK